MWFIYLNYYLLYVVELSPSATASALLSGQISDGLTTPIVGVASDKVNCPAGKRNTWYFMGTLLVLPSFLGIFINTPGFLTTTKSEDIWYCVLPAIFNVGWASVQIAHMSIVNQLSYSQRRRDRMVNLRNGFTYVANICVLSVSLVLFVVFTNPATSFTILCLMCLGFGSVSSLFYSVTIREKTLSREAIEMEAAYKKDLGGPAVTERINPTADLDGSVLGKEDEVMHEEVKKQTASQWRDWLKKPQFYIFGVVYMFARIALNSTATMMPLYLTTCTGFVMVPDKGIPPQIALVPLCSYICSLIYTLYGQARITQKFRNRMIPLILSVGLVSLGSIPYAFLTATSTVRWLVYPLAGV